MKRLFDGFYSRFDMSGLKEFTMEAGRPDSITPSKLKVMKEYGIEPRFEAKNNERVSIGTCAVKDTMKGDLF